MRRFYSLPENISEGRARLDEDETRHLRDVLRLRAGDEASVFDGHGREYACTIESVSKKESVLAIIEEIPPAAPESPLELTLAAAVLPTEKFDLVVQKAVELGVVTLQPLYTKRCEARVESGRRRAERWKKIALEAAKQSGRAKLMEVAEPCRLADFVAHYGPARPERDGTLILFSERDGTDLSEISAGSKIVAVVGPKGGWEDDELTLARDSGFSVITLGGRILRAETASIALSAILQHRFGDLS